MFHGGEELFLNIELKNILDRFLELFDHHRKINFNFLKL